MPKTFKILPKRWRFTKSGHTSGTQGLIPRNEEIAFFCEKWNGDRTELKVDAPKRMIDRDSNCALQSSHPYYQLKNINHIVLYLFPLILSISHSSSWFSQSRSMFKRNKQKWGSVCGKVDWAVASNNSGSEFGSSQFNLYWIDENTEKGSVMALFKMTLGGRFENISY